MIPRAQHPAPYIWKPRDFPFFCCFIFLPVTPKHQVAPKTTFLFDPVVRSTHRLPVDCSSYTCIGLLSTWVRPTTSPPPPHIVSSRMAWSTSEQQTFCAQDERKIATAVAPFIMIAAAMCRVAQSQGLIKSQKEKNR